MQLEETAQTLQCLWSYTALWLWSLHITELVVLQIVLWLSSRWYHYQRLFASGIPYSGTQPSPVTSVSRCYFRICFYHHQVGITGCLCLRCPILAGKPFTACFPVTIPQIMALPSLWCNLDQALERCSHNHPSGDGLSSCGVALIVLEFVLSLCGVASTVLEEFVWCSPNCPWGICVVFVWCSPSCPWGICVV